MVAAETLPPDLTSRILREVLVYVPGAVDVVTDVALLYSKSTAPPDDTSDRVVLS